MLHITIFPSTLHIFNLNQVCVFSGSMAMGRRIATQSHRVDNIPSSESNTSISGYSLGPTGSIEKHVQDRGEVAHGIFSY